MNQARSFSEVMKSDPSGGDTHVSTALGNSGRRRRARLFSAFVSGGKKLAEVVDKRYATVADLPAAVREKFKDRPKKLRQWMHVWNGEFASHSDEARAFASAWAAVQKVSASPFPYDAEFLAKLREAQVPSFLRALTHPGELPKARVKLASLVAIQDRISPRHVAERMGKPGGGRPTVVKLSGQLYIADGHDRLSARLLVGKTDAKVRLHDIDDPVDPTALKKAKILADAVVAAGGRDWSTSFRIEKADPDKQQLFGWASTSTIGGKMVVDKQGDMIPPDELENAAYDFVLTARTMGDMHTRTSDVGRMIESCVFTKEKQKVLGIDLGKEAWWVGFQCDCKDLWKDIRNGRKLEFSIGGAAIPEKVSD